MKKYIKKEWLYRAIRTFLQTAVGYIAVNIAAYITADADIVTFKNALLTVGTAAVAAGISAVMNLNKDAETMPADIIKNMRDIQATDGNWNSSEYNCGYYNGIELVSSTLENREPEFHEYTTQ